MKESDFYLSFATINSMSMAMQNFQGNGLAVARLRFIKTAGSPLTTTRRQSLTFMIVNR
jgi:hypothetical protein